MDDALATMGWRQGDCALGEQWFAYRFEPKHPLTTEAVQAAELGAADLAEAEVRGVMIATQTCDIVRSCADRPFVEVCPLVLIKEEGSREVETGLRPRYAHVPGVAGHHLAADLDRVMTVEKGVLLGWERVEGCRTDAERRRLATALARKRKRFAFPNDFVEWMRPLQGRWTKKHGKPKSDEGQALRAIQEIRVQARPSWDAARVALHFVFIKGDDETDAESAEVGQRQVAAWMKRLEGLDGCAPGRFESIGHSFISLDDLTARDYVESDPLDLHHLSDGGQ